MQNVLQNTFKSSIFDMSKCAQILSPPFLSYIYQVLQNTGKSSIFDMPNVLKFYRRHFCPMRGVPQTPNLRIPWNSNRNHGS